MNGPVACELLIHSSSELVTVAGGTQRPRRGPELADSGVIDNGAVAGAGGRILAAGRIDASGKTVLPGFVDPHTHVVHAGSREFELGMRLAGRSYMDILAAGGGILHTVKATRAASLDELAAQTRRRLDVMLAHGTTTVE